MQIDSILIYESPTVTSLYPFTILHCGWELRLGANLYYEKIQKFFPDAKLMFQGREKHLESFYTRYNPKRNEFKKENILVLNTAIYPSIDFFDSLDKFYNEHLKQDLISKSALFVHNGKPIAVYMAAEDVINPSDKDLDFLPKIISEFSRLIPQIEIPEPKLINFLWDAFDDVGKDINDSKDYYTCHVDEGKLKIAGVHLVNPDNIRICDSARIAPGVVIDASEGAVIIDRNARIMANAVLEGPCYIGENSTVKIGAKIYGNTAIGKHCKIGGEIENSIIQGYSNKQHEGFLGHSFISEWVNLGADTNTSDLKNTYSNISVNFYKQEIDTGRMFLGLLCGDHTKSAINTSFTTGTVAGICGIVVADGFLPNYIPSFAWRGVKNCTFYKPDKAIETARIVMKRRGKELTEIEETLIRDEFTNAKSIFYNLL